MVVGRRRAPPSTSSMLEWLVVSAPGKPFRPALAGLLLLLALPSCGAAEEPQGPEAAEVEDEPVLLGEVTREEIEEAVPSWVAETASAEIHEAEADALAAVEPGAEVTVFLGTWCSDSRREVPRLWRALDHAGDQAGGEVPFEVEYVGVDRDKEEPADLLAGQDLAYVPTLVVRRDGREVGRIVESAPGGVEGDLLSLLDGWAWGVLTGRDDLDP